MIKTYKENYSDFIITIEDENLIKPSDLHKHIDEVLMFHNGLGYIVSAKLTACNISADKYSFEPYENGIQYEDELMMDMFYHPNDAFAINDTVYSAKLIANGIHKDDIMRDIKYIAKPTEEELKFRNKILALNDEWYKQYYDYLTYLEMKYNVGATLFPVTAIISEEDQKEVDKIFNN